MRLYVRQLCKPIMKKFRLRQNPNRLAVGSLVGMIYGPVIMPLFIMTIEIFAEYFAAAKEELDTNELKAIEAQSLTGGHVGTS